MGKRANIDLPLTILSPVNQFLRKARKESAVGTLETKERATIKLGLPVTMNQTNERLSQGCLLLRLMEVVRLITQVSLI